MRRMMMSMFLLRGFVVLVAVISPCLAGEAPLVRLKGTDFKGGGAFLYGSTQQGRINVNYVYAAPAGECARMTATFNLTSVPSSPLFLLVEGRDDDAKDQCPIEISINGVSVSKGSNEFSAKAFEWKKYAIGPGVLKRGANTVMFANRAAEGVAGMPPWFMVARVALGPQDIDVNAPPPITEDFRVTLPAEVRPYPEPGKEGQRVPAFKIRGTKGWKWFPEQYLAEIPVLAGYKMNFLMNCYLSMFDIENQAVWHSGEANRWWEPLPAEKKKKYEAVVRSCREHEIEFCFAINPNLASKRILDYDSPRDLEDLWQHYAWMAGLGVNWFSICLDDISAGINPDGQARLCNEILRRLRDKNPKAQLIFCPTRYWGNGDDPQSSGYLAVLASKLNPEVYCFWTGDEVVGPITRAAAEKYKAHIKHPLVIWDNYPVNDNAPTLHLGPVVRRDPDLCELVDGYMANPLCPQNEIGRIPMLTIADYAYNPWSYDPARSIGQAIVHLAETAEQREVLKDLVELYPGMLLDNRGTNWNPMLVRFQEILNTAHSRFLAEVYLRHVEDVARRLSRYFTDRFGDAVKTLQGNIDQMKTLYRERYGQAF